MSVPTLVKIELDLASAGGCQNPDCKTPNCNGELFLNPKCHPGVGVDASYTNGTGEIRFRCRVCNRPIVAVKVAEA